MTQQSTPRWHSPGQLQPPWWRGSPWLTASWVLGRPSSACPTLAPTTAAAVTRLDGGLTGWQLGIGTIHMLWWNEAYCGVTVYWLVQVCWGCCWFWPYQINVMVKISLTFSYVFIRKIQYKYRFGKQSCWFFLSFWRINDDSLTFSAFFFFFSVSLGRFLLCFLLCFGPALPRIPDHWVRYALWMGMTYQESIWLPSFPGISSVFKRCWNVRRGKCESIDYCTDAFHCRVQQWNVWTILYLESIPRTEVTWSLSFSAIPLSTPCSLSSPWCWTKMLSQRSQCYTQSCTKISWRWLISG